MLKIGGRRGSIGSYAAFQELPESSFAQDPDPKIGRVFSSMDDHTMSVIDTLRYLPYNIESSTRKSYPLAASPTFEGAVDLQAASSLLPTQQWQQAYVEVSNGTLMFRRERSQTHNTGRFPISFVLSTDAVPLEASATATGADEISFSISDSDGKDNGSDVAQSMQAIAEKRRREFDVHFKNHADREIGDHIVKVVTPDSIVIMKCQSESQKVDLLEGIERSLRPLVGEEIWADKVQAAKKVTPLLKKELFLQRYRMETIMTCLAESGLANACSSMLASSSKKFQGTVEVNEFNISGNLHDRMTSNTYFMILHDQSLYWFASSSAQRPTSFLALTFASAGLDTNEIRNGRWVFYVKTPLRKLSFRAKHAVALCEWLHEIQQTINQCRQEAELANALKAGMEAASAAGDRPVKPTHRKKQSLLSTILRGPQHPLDAKSVPLLEGNGEANSATPTTMDIAMHLSHIVDLRVAGYTVDHCIESEPAMNVFVKFLDESEERCLLECLIAIDKCIATIPIDPAAARQLVDTFVSNGSPDQLPHLSPEMASAIERDVLGQAKIPVTVFDDLRRWVSPKVDQLFGKLKRTAQFRAMVQREVGDTDSASHDFNNPVDMELALQISVKGESGHQTFVLDSKANSITIGRDPSNDVILSDKHVSRSHIRITYTKKHAELFDLGSSTGATVNGAKTQHCALVPGDVIVIGITSIKFDLYESRVRRGSRLVSEMFRRMGGWESSQTSQDPQDRPDNNAGSN